MITEEASRHCAHTHTQQLFHQQFAFFLRQKVGMKSLHDYKQVHDAKPLLIFTTLEPRYGIRILTVSVSDASIGRAKANNFSPPFGELSHCVCTMNIHIDRFVINIVGLIEWGATFCVSTSLSVVFLSFFAMWTEALLCCWQVAGVQWRCLYADINVDCLLKKQFVLLSSWKSLSINLLMGTKENYQKSFMDEHKYLMNAFQWVS